MYFSKILSKLHSLTSLLKNFFPIIGVILFILFAGGSIYSMVEPSIWAYPMGSRFTFIMPFLDYQTIVESVVVLILLLGGTLGLFLTERGSRISSDPKYASIILGIGVALFIFSFILLQYLLAIKIGWI
ncbi:MAG: hypothetical protein NDF53_01240 [archaeon GB-1867-097]|nr:hypothetical protein [Candidatus Culexmicrobium thermophilum]MCS7384346.1 hypothetical protein [Candidatus Culexmicrobium thermophilum]RLE53572.1 MAG: hypothetical protein DRJ30_06705 [Candidatus Verstraetearchaeota archaeon]HDO20295.1 hypothetical protein [Candidatus Bathyarchaeota archaeon]